ncbi:MAG TPA: hypothetical protein PLP05_11790, partial [Sedimentisphaerales bacterium]|nr:hypothetical protein [Sedimentisphaerales bacterium]
LDLYTGFPITVEQTDNNTYQDEQNRGAAIPFKTNTTSKSNAAPLSRLLKPGIVAAAVILIAAGVFFSTPTAKAISIGQIYRAMDKIKNIYIANFAPGDAEPRQEFWVSREQDVYLTKTENETVFYDLDNGQRKVKLPDANTIENIQLTDDLIYRIKPEMYSLFGIMPFANISDIPADAQWNLVTKNDDGVEIYDLIWTAPEFTGAKRYWKYKFYVDGKTNLPFKIELYSRLSIGEDYTLVNLRLMKYLDSDEFEAIVREKGF